eukprot:TRINITY_DN10945_c0_g1_i3.p1 TRINITY_DN10945_c0_g1~~TRINITY_DN10945_c0_g1_i3.p1  ORF type:complete len:159 (+),score=40.95 TRINITY_DN10945_c0_g1_i3:145-621(+)
MHFEPALKEKGLAVPLLFLQAEQSLHTFGRDLSLGDIQELISHSSKEVKDKSAFLVLKGQNHNSSTDVALFTPAEILYFSKLGMSLPSDITPLFEIQNTMIVEFLERTLQKDASSLKSDESLANTLRNVVKKSLSLDCLLYTSPSPRDRQKSRMPSSA